jgi:hypothetical protein
MFTALAACSGDTTLVIEPPWPEDQVALIVAIDDRLEIVGQPMLLEPGGVLRLSFDARRRLIARTYPRVENGGPDFSACGFAIGGEGDSAPAPIASWSASIDVDSSSIAFTREREATALDVRLPHCPSLCAQVIARPVPITILTGNFQDVAVPSERAAFAVLIGDLEMRRDLLRWDAASGEVTRIELGFDPLWVSTDHAGTTWVTVPRKVFALDDDGSIIARYDTGLMGAGVSAGLDGTVIVWGQGGILELTRSATAARPRIDFPSPRVDVFVVEASQIVTVVPGAIQFYDGNAWTMETRDVALDFDWVAFGDREELGVIGPTNLYLRDRERKTWQRLSPPSDTFPPDGAVHLGGRRFVAAGDVGFAGLGSGGRWCKLETGTLRPFQAIDVAPSKRFAVAVGDNEDAGTEPVFMVFDLSLLDVR